MSEKKPPAKEPKKAEKPEPYFEKIKEQILDFMAKHRGTIYLTHEVQLAMIAHNYPVKDVEPDDFLWSLDELVSEGKIRKYVRLS